MSRRKNMNTRGFIIRYIEAYAAREGKQPSIREIGKAAKISSLSTVSGYLRRMLRDGLLEQSTQIERNYYLTEKARSL